MPKKRFTPAQQHFCDEWLIDHNGTRAYKVAYPKVKKDSTAAANASRLLTNAKVWAYIEMRRAEMAAKFKIDRERVLREEACIAFSNIGDLFEDGKLLDPDKMPEEIRRAIKRLKVKELPNGSKEYYCCLYDKGSALARLSKQLGMYEKGNRQKNPSIDEVYSAFKEVSPELAEAVRKKFLAKIGP